MDINKYTKIKAIMLLHALGDTIGFKNGEWEFNGFNNDVTFDYVNELIYQFIDLGGVNGINLENWHISDDTILHIAIANALIKTKKSDSEQIKSFLSKTKKNFEIEYEKMIEDKKNNIDRYIGITTEKSIKNGKNDNYDKIGGGNGSAMRTPIIGACFLNLDNLDNLIDFSIKSSILTHNNSIGFLAGFTSAYFVSLAMIDIPIKKWPYMLIECLKTNHIKKYITTDDHASDYYDYINYWKKYIDLKFDNKMEPIKSRANSNPIHRIRFYYDTFSRENTKKIIESQLGGSGYLCMIMAYDSLLDCDGYWEKLIVYSMLHIGDSDTIGAIAGALYGATYGFGDVPKDMLKHIERKEELKKIAKDITQKYYPIDHELF